MRISLGLGWDVIDLCFRKVARVRMRVDPGYRKEDTELGTALGREGPDMAKGVERGVRLKGDSQSVVSWEQGTEISRRLKDGAGRCGEECWSGKNISISKLVEFAVFVGRPG